MEIKIPSAVLCITASTAFAAGNFVTWNGAVPDSYRVETGLGNETETHGYWYSYNDESEGGESNITYPIEPCLDYSSCPTNFLDPVIEVCQGLCATANLSKGALTKKPYAGVGFNIVGETSFTDKTIAAGDATAWDGICVTYTSEADLQLELGLGDPIDSTISHANPAITLPASQSGNKVVASWADFKQPSWYDDSIKFDGPSAVKQLVGLHFKLQADPGKYDFKICAVGPKDGTCPEKCGLTDTKGTFVTWNGADENPQVQTGLGNGTETNGYWFFYTDKESGGESSIAWPVPSDDPDYADLGPVVLECKGLCGSAHLKKGTSTEKPFVGLAFSVAGETSETDKTLAVANASAWGGLCVSYASDVDLQLQLGTGPIANPDGKYLDGNGPDTEPPEAGSYTFANLPASPTGNMVRVAWLDFKQGSSETSGEAASKELAMILFKMKADDGDYNFKICAVGPKDGTCPEKCSLSASVDGFKNVFGNASAKAVLNGRTLGFAGVKSANVEVMNVLGQIVAKGSIESDATTLGLAHLDAGIYLVRVIGKSVNFTNKIILK